MSSQSIWMLQTKRADFHAVAERFHISPVTARIIRNRDVVGEEDIEKYLHGTTKDLYSPHLLKDLDLAVGILRQKKAEGKHIRIVGDYDIDGVCSTYLLYKALTRIGARVDYRIPDRILDGYGINERIIREAEADGVDTILTCDNGIAAIEQIRLAKESGMTVIVTDHHDIAEKDGCEVLPLADAVVNPKQKACIYPFDGICGAVVAYKLVQALYEAEGINPEEWLAMLEFAAIATVGDVMKLKDENRILVKWGLRSLPRTQSVGLRALVLSCGLDIEQVSAYHIGFVIGPCLNAGGRLQTALLALELLLCEDTAAAERLAEELKTLNDQRKAMTAAGVEEACKIVEEQYMEDKVLVIYLPDCHESLAGIVAGRIREKYHKPSLVLTKGEESVKGSGRSIEAYHMFHALLEVRDLLLKFGGHPMAAGFSLREQDIEEFRRRLNENSKLTQGDFIPKIWIDVPMPFEYITEGLVEELKLLEPFGQGNEKPQFAQKGLHIREARVIGKNKNVVRFSLVTEKGNPMNGILFGDGEAFMKELGNRRMMDVIYYPDVNEYNGNRSLQVVIKEYKLS